jgi:hypothetical protein
MNYLKVTLRNFRRRAFSSALNVGDQPEVKAKGLPFAHRDGHAALVRELGVVGVLLARARPVAAITQPSKKNFMETSRSLTCSMSLRRKIAIEALDITVEDRAPQRILLSQWPKWWPIVSRNAGTGHPSRHYIASRASLPQAIHAASTAYLGGSRCVSFTPSLRR